MYGRAGLACALKICKLEFDQVVRAGISWHLTGFGMLPSPSPMVQTVLYDSETMNKHLCAWDLQYVGIVLESDLPRSRRC